MSRKTTSSRPRASSAEKEAEKAAISREVTASQALASQPPRSAQASASGASDARDSMPPDSLNAALAREIESTLTASERSDAAADAPLTSLPDPLHARLLALDDDTLAPPTCEPEIALEAAARAIAVVRSDAGRARFSELSALGGIERAAVDDLERLSVALAHVLEVFEGVARSPLPIALDPELDARAQAQRRALVALLERRAMHLPNVARRIDEVRAGFGSLDLAADLRALARLVDAHRTVLAVDEAWSLALTGETLALAAQLEHALFSRDTPELRESRIALHRIWAGFAEVYESVAAAGRHLFQDAAAAGDFRPLDTIAAHGRTAKRARSSRPAAPDVWGAREAREGGTIMTTIAPPSAARAPRSTGKLKAAATALADATSDRPADGAPHFDVELSATSASNLYMGRSDDIADAGIFVATSHTKKVGAWVVLALTLPGIEAPVEVAGIVRWVRPHASREDTLPSGVGVKLERVPTHAASALQKFATTRTPIFYDD